MSVHPYTQKDGTKSWKVRWRQGDTNRSRSFSRHRDALLFDAEVRRRRETGELATLTGGTQTLREYGEQWWIEYAEQNLSERSLEIYANQWAKRISPQLGGFKLREITPRVVEAFITQLRREHVGDASIVKATTVLQSILRHAEIEGIIARNPVTLVRKPS